MHTSGIYCILNTKNSKRYIGQSTSMETRRCYHFSALRHNSHPNTHLQAAFKKYGDSSFKWVVLSVVCGTSSLDAEERAQIALYRSNAPEYGYNNEPGGLTRPRASCATRRRMQQAQSRRRAKGVCDFRDKH